jgi:hypothetical protein
VSGGQIVGKVAFSNGHRQCAAPNMEALHIAIRALSILIAITVTGCANFKPVSYWWEGGSGSLIDPLSISQARWKSAEAKLGAADHPALNDAWGAYQQAKRYELIGNETAIDEYYRARKANSQSYCHDRFSLPQSSSHFRSGSTSPP